MSELEKFDFSDIFPSEQSKFVRFDDVKDMISQPQLTIPQSIADLLDEELNPLKRESMIETFVLGVNYLVLSDELMKFVITGDNYHIICAYLAGKALGVDLVKVLVDMHLMSQSLGKWL